MSDVLTAYGAFRPGYGHDGAAAENYLGSVARQIARSDPLHGPLFAREFMRGIGEAYGKRIYDMANKRDERDDEDEKRYQRLDIGKLPSSYNGGHCKTCTCSGAGAGYVSGKMAATYTINHAQNPKDTMKDAGLEDKLGKN